MDESREHRQPIRWEIKEDGSVTLDPLTVIGWGHLEMYRNQPEEFHGFGIAVKDPPPEEVTKLFHEHEARGEKLRVNVKGYEDMAPFILMKISEDDKYPWRLISEREWNEKQKDR